MHTDEVAAASTVEYAPGGQLVHTHDEVAAATVPYVPAPHAVQPLAPVVRSVYVPGAQLVHTVVNGLRE